MHRARSREPEEDVGPILLRAFLCLAALSVVLLAFLSTTPPPQDLLIPVRGVSPSDLSDSFVDPRDGSRLHEAIDILAPWGTPVVAANDAVVHRLVTSERGGIGLYLLDRERGRCYYYGHLARYTRGLREGRLVGRGETLGFVGSTGNASPNAPHLHFAVYDLSGETGCYSGTPVDPFPLLAPASAFTD